MIPKETYKEVWSAMDACNASGVIHSLDKWVGEIWLEANELGKGTDYVNAHPIIVIVADKLLQLAHNAQYRIDHESDIVLGNAYQYVCEQAN